MSHWVGGDGTWDGVGTAHWSTITDGPGGGPIPSSTEDAIFDSATPATVLVSGGRSCKNIVTSAPASGSVSLLNGPGTISCFGNATFYPGTTFTVSTITFNAAADYTIDANGVDLFFPQLNGSAKATLLSNFKTTSNFWMNGSSKFDANDFNVTLLSCDFTGGSPKTVWMGNGVWTALNVSGGGSSFDFSSGLLTLNSEGSTIEVNNISSGNFAIHGNGSQALNKVKFLDTGTGSGIFTINSSFTIGTVEALLTRARSWRFAAGATYTVTNWNCRGAAGQLLSIASTSASTAFNLVKSGGGVVSSSYLSITDSAASPADTWYAGATSTGLRTSGWLFENAPVTNTSILTQLYGRDQLRQRQRMR